MDDFRVRGFGGIVLTVPSRYMLLHTIEITEYGNNYGQLESDDFSFKSSEGFEMVKERFWNHFPSGTFHRNHKTMYGATAPAIAARA